MLPSATRKHFGPTLYSLICCSLHIPNLQLSLYFGVAAGIATRQAVHSALQDSDFWMKANMRSSMYSLSFWLRGECLSFGNSSSWYGFCAAIKELMRRAV